MKQVKASSLKTNSKFKYVPDAKNTYVVIHTFKWISSLSKYYDGVVFVNSLNGRPEICWDASVLSVWVEQSNLELLSELPVGGEFMVHWASGPDRYKKLGAATSGNDSRKLYIPTKDVNQGRLLWIEITNLEEYEVEVIADEEG